MLTASQIRASRAILNWSQQELANAANLSLATIRKTELGHICPRNTTTKAIYDVLYTAGIEFIDPDGARRRPSEMMIFEGLSGGQAFFEHMAQAVSKNGGPVCIVTPSAQALAHFCGLKTILGLDALVDANSSTEVKCLLLDEEEPAVSTPRLQFRTISRNYAEPMPFLTFGSRFVLAVTGDETFGKLISFDSAKMAISAKAHFFSLWDKAPAGGITLLAKTKATA